MKTYLFILINIFFLNSSALSQTILLQSIKQNYESLGPSGFGTSISSSGDINNDGHIDFVIGAPFWNAKGAVYIYLGGSQLKDTADIVIYGTDGGSFGSSVSIEGDLNNDGYNDLIVGAYFYNHGKGRIYIFWGGDTFDKNADLIIDSPVSARSFGYSLGSGGDLNNDGFDDLVASLPSRQGYDAGTAYVYYGGNAMDAVPDLIITEEGRIDFSLSLSGDVNNDGFDDLVAGASQYNYSSGRVYIYFGGPSMDDSADVILDGTVPYHNFGKSVLITKDINADNFDDVVVCAPYSVSGGAAYIFFGGAPMNTSPDLILKEVNEDIFGYKAISSDMNGDGNNDIVVLPGSLDSLSRAYLYYGGAGMDNTADQVFSSESAGNRFGFSAANVGDLNADGFEDIIICEEKFKDGIGRASLYFGGASVDSIPDFIFNGLRSYSDFGLSVSNAGDFNNDGYDDLILGAKGKAYLVYGNSEIDSTPGRAYSISEVSYNYNVSSVGDVNGDNYEDVIIGIPEYNNNNGTAYIYFGDNSPDFSQHIILKGDGQYFGSSVSTAGDVNNDGFNDIIVGAYGFNNKRGQAYIYYGGNSLDSLPDITLLSEGNYSEFGFSVANAGDVNSDGYDDVIVGAPSYSPIIGSAHLFLGGENMDGVADYSFLGTGGNFGFDVSGAGDLNADGFDDVLIGDPWAGHHGEVHIFFGGTSINDSADVILQGTGEYNSFGHSVSGAGDLNNDNYADFIVTELKYSGAGSVHVFYGSASIGSTPVQTLTGEGYLFGNSISFAGDVNNDGRSDFVIGDPSAVINGRVYIYTDTSSISNVQDYFEPNEYWISQNFPNPFNPITNIRYNIPKDGFVTVKVYDILGREIKTLVNKHQPVGVHEVFFNADDLSSGIYIYEIKCGEFFDLKKMMLIK